MPAHKVVDESGTPQQHTLYAVFDDEEHAQQAERALQELGARPHTLGGADAQALREPPDSSGILGTVRRLVKGFGGESAEAKRYATHLDHGRIVLAVPVADRSAADRLTKLLVQQGGYDITYFSGTTVEEMSPAENARHGVPDHIGDPADERATGDRPVRP